MKLAFAVLAVVVSSIAPVAAAPPNYPQLAADAVRAALRDPSSVRDAMRTPPFEGYFGTVNVCVRMNAKNAFGGYTGPQVMVVMFKGDRVKLVPDTNPGCDKYGWKPFVELTR